MPNETKGMKELLRLCEDHIIWLEEGTSEGGDSDIAEMKSALAKIKAALKTCAVLKELSEQMHDEGQMHPRAFYADEIDVILQGQIPD